MPRLENSNADVLEYFELEFDEDDPGATEPVDVCAYCAQVDGWVKLGLTGAEHPPYEELDYTCASCGVSLEECDN